MLRRGVTLVELLIVIVIMLMVTAVVIRATAPALSGRRVREAARMVDVFINGARSRAQQTGNSYGVMIERTPIANNATGQVTSSMGISLAYVEVPAPYMGDFSGSKIRMAPNGMFATWDWFANVYDSPTGPSPNNPYSIFPLGDTGWIGNVSPGDILVFKGQQYRLYTGEPFIDVNANGVCDPGEPFYDCDGSSAWTPPPAGFVDQATGYFSAVPPPGSVAMTFMYYDPVMAANTMSPTGGISPLATGLPMSRDSSNPAYDPLMPISGSNYPVIKGSGPGFGPFEIIRRPIKAAGTDQQLPDGTAIDLGGFDGSGNTLQANVVPGSGLDIFSSAPGIPPFFATFRLNPALGANDNSPVVITFAPNGIVDKIFSWDERNLAVAGGSIINGVPVGWQGRQPTSQIFLLVTRRELIGGDTTVITPSAATPQYGIQDLTSLWVTINPQTGLINTAANGPLAPALFAGSPPPYYLQCYQARQEARKTQSAGGR